MLKLLFIEDEPDTIEPIQHLIEEESKDMQCEVVEFEDAEDKIASLRPQHCDTRSLSQWCFCRSRTQRSGHL